MTAAQLGYTFDVMFDSIANYSSPGFTNQEKSELFNQAQENIYLDVINPQITPRSSAVTEELNKIISAELINNTGDLIPSIPQTPVLGSELVGNTSYWVLGSGWTGTFPTFTHSSGTTALYYPYDVMNPTSTYYITLVIAGRTAGSITIRGLYNLGADSYDIAVGVTTTQNIQFIAPELSQLSIYPTTDFNGTITLSLKQLTNVDLVGLRYGQFIELPTDFFFPLAEFADIQFLSTSYFYAFTDKYPNHISTNVYVKPIAQLDFNNGWWSHIRRPYEDLVWRTEHSRRTPTSPISSTNRKVYELFGNEEYTIYRYKASYYRRLVDIDIDSNITCELDPFIHRTLIKDAIKLGALTINDKDKYQMASIEKNN
jgi:hypothetical protein